MESFSRTTTQPFGFTSLLTMVVVPHGSLLRYSTIRLRRGGDSPGRNVAIATFRVRGATSRRRDSRTLKRSWEAVTIDFAIHGTIAARPTRRDRRCPATFGASHVSTAHVLAVDDDPSILKFIGDYLGDN